MPRKGHKKSRLGCAQCKKRHVKCDETPGPTCVNCRTANVECSYRKRYRDTISSTTTSPGTQYAYTLPTPQSSVADFNSIGNIHTPPSNFNDIVPVNLVHLELLHDFSTEIYKSFAILPSVALNYRETAIKNGLRYPFLFHELLAISALHLSVMRPEQASFYREQASILQASAVHGCKQDLANINDENCVAVFLFASMTGVHSFCESLTYRNQDFHTFLDKITGSITLLRGVLAVIGQCWSTLRTSDLADMLSASSAMYENPVHDIPDFDPLRTLIQDHDLGEASRTAYQNALTELQRVFNNEQIIERVDGTISMMFAWLVRSETVYINLLTQRRPEALIIFAHFAVILHRGRSSWAIQDSGKILVTSIVHYLGAHWARWLEWPVAAVQS